MNHLALAEKLFHGHMSTKASKPVPTKANKPVTRGSTKTGTLSRKSSSLTGTSTVNKTVKAAQSKDGKNVEATHPMKETLKIKGNKKENDEENIAEGVIIPCEPCIRKNNSVESGGFCLECGENLCSDCIAYHKTLKITENHTIVDGKRPDDDSLASISLDSKLAETPDRFSETPTRTYHTHDHETRPSKFVATEKCAVHDDKLIELYCEDDTELICSVCAGTVHRRCRSVLYIPKAAEGIRKDKRCREVKEKLTELKTKFGKLIKERQRNIWSYEKQREDALKSIAHFRESIDKLLDEMQASMEQEIEKKFKKGKGVYESNLKQCEETLSALTKRILKLEDDIRKNDEAKIFMDLKLYNDDVRMYSAKYDEEANAEGYKLKVVIDDSLKQMIKREHLIRSVTYGKPINTGDYSVKMKVGGLTMLPDGRLVIHDDERLVLVNENFTVNEYSQEFLTPGPPNAICALDSNTVALTMHKMKQVIILNCRHDLEEKVTFTLRSKSVGNGLSGFEEKLYCLCRADNDELSESPRTAIYIYNLAGEKRLATEFKYHFQVIYRLFLTST